MRINFGYWISRKINARCIVESFIFIAFLYSSHCHLDIMWITILEAHLGKDRNLCPPDGKFVVIQEVEFTMLITIQEVLHGKDLTQRDYSISNTGKVKGSTLFNREIKDSSILR